ncbi:MAG: hypothetical protein ABRQ38_15725 [Candidatus Eremiobacterota bacterium]
MLIQLYEEIISDSGERLPGRLSVEITCDGNKGEFKFYDACRETRENRDRNHPGYGLKRQILSKNDRKLLEKLFNEPLFITSNAGLDTDGVHYMGGKTLLPWHRETIQYILDYRLASWFGTLCGKIVSSE